MLRARKGAKLAWNGYAVPLLDWQPDKFENAVGKRLNLFLAEIFSAYLKHGMHAFIAIP